MSETRTNHETHVRNRVNNASCAECGPIEAEAAQGAAPRAEGHEHGPWIRDPVHGSSDAFCQGCGAAWEPTGEPEPMAAPRAEGLDVPTLAKALHQMECNLGRSRNERHEIADRHDERLWRQQAEALADSYARLSRPSDERVPESEDSHE